MPWRHRWVLTLVTLDGLFFTLKSCDSSSLLLARPSPSVFFLRSAKCQSANRRGATCRPLHYSIHAAALNSKQPQYRLLGTESFPSRYLVHTARLQLASPPIFSSNQPHFDRLVSRCRYYFLAHYLEHQPTRPTRPPRPRIIQPCRPARRS